MKSLRILLASLLLAAPAFAQTAVHGQAEEIQHGTSLPTNNVAAYSLFILVGGAQPGLYVCMPSNDLYCTSGGDYVYGGVSSTTTISFNGTQILNPNINATSPVADFGYQAATPKCSGSNCIIEFPDTGVVEVLGSTVANPNFNASAPAPDSGFYAATPKSSASAVIIEIPNNSPTASALATTPTQCNNAFLTGIQASGNGNCSGATYIQLPETTNPGGASGQGILWFDLGDAAIRSLINSVDANWDFATGWTGIEIPNDPTTGTAMNALVTYTSSSPLNAITPQTTTDKIVGVCEGYCGTSGTATVAKGGSPAVTFDGASTAGDYVVPSTGTLGQVHDTGSTSCPASVQALGRVIMSEGTGGVYAMYWGAPECSGSTLSLPLSVANGGTGASTLTGPLKGNGTSPFTAAAAADIVGLFSGCSGTQYLGVDGACHTASGAPGGSSTQLEYNNSGSFGGISDYTFDGSHTISMGASGILNLSAAAANAFKIPVAAGAAPTVNGNIANNSTNGTIAFGSSGATAVVAVAAAGTNTGTTCSGQVITAISGRTTPTCTTVSSGMTDTTIAKTGVDISTSYQVTSTHLSAPLPVTQGGTGASTLSGILKGNGTSLFTAAAYSDVVSLFTGCSGVQYLGADGNCHSGGISTFSGDGSLISNVNSTGAVTVTMASAAGHSWWGNNTGSSGSPAYETIGTADLPAALANQTSINGLSITGSTGTLSITNGKTVSFTNGLTFSGTDSTTMTFPSTSQTIPGLAQANTFSGADTFSANGAASTPGVTVSGTPYTAGTGTTNFPQLYLNSGVTGPTTFSTAGTAFGINAPSGFTGNYFDFYVNGGSEVSLSAAGNFKASEFNGLTISSSTGTLSVTNGKTVSFTNGLTFSGTDSTTMTFPSTSQTIPGMNQANTAGSSFTLDISAGGANSFKVPVIAGATSGADGVIAYDSTNKETHIRTNGGDSIAIASTANLTANTIPKANITSSVMTAVNSSIVDNGTVIKTAEPIISGNTVRLTADSSGITGTTPGTTFLTMTTLAANNNYSFDCFGTYSQATATALDGFSVQGATNAPTRMDAWGSMDVSNPTSTTYTGSKSSALNITSTTSTPVVSGTPGATGTVYQFELHGTIQVGASVPTLNFAAFTGSGSDAITIKAGTFCSLR